MVSEGRIDQLTELFQGNNSSDNLSPVVQKFTEEFTGNLETRFGVNTETASSVATSLIPKILGSLMKKAKDPNENSFQISDLQMLFVEVVVKIRILRMHFLNMEDDSV